MINQEIDILIVGGGLTGATLLLALQGLGYSTLLVDAQPLAHKVNPDFDARTLALSPASQRILNQLKIWQPLQEHVTSIEMIHVSEQSRFGASRLQSKPHDPLGYVVEMQYLHQALHHLLDTQSVLAPATVYSLDLENNTVSVKTEAGERQIKARLIVAADGAHSAIRKMCDLPCETKLYVQQAIVANIGLLQAHQGRAYERFTQHGPLALLPMQKNRMALVWALPPDEAAQYLALSDEAFLQKLQQAFGYRLGRLAKIGKRFAYPLQQVLMPQLVKNSVVFIGNAAHTLHPVAGQGFNLGLRDVATLAQCIAQQGLNVAMLKEYVQLRAHDQKAIIRLTDDLIRVFTSRIPGLGIARGLGLMAFDNLPSLKKLLAHYARGFGGVAPNLVCDIALKGE